MTHKRDDDLLNLRRLAHDAFREFAIAEFSEGRIVCRKAGSGNHAFEIVMLGWGCLCVGGDIEHVIFQGGDGGQFLDRLAWLAGGDVEYIRGKAQRASGRDFWAFDHEEFAQCLDEMIADYRVRLTPDAEGAIDGGENEQRKMEAIIDFAAEVRCQELARDEVWRKAYDLDLGFEGSMGSVFAPELVWAHEAARTAFRLADEAACATAGVTFNAERRARAVAAIDYDERRLRKRTVT